MLQAMYTYSLEDRHYWAWSRLFFSVLGAHQNRKKEQVACGGKLELDLVAVMLNFIFSKEHCRQKSQGMLHAVELFPAFQDATLPATMLPTAHLPRLGTSIGFTILARKCSRTHFNVVYCTSLCIQGDALSRRMPSS